MKNLLLLLYVILYSQLNAQPYYFSENSASYEPLTDSISINNSAVWSGFQTFNVPIGFSFNYMDDNFTTFDFEASGRIIFDANHYYFADLFTVAGLEDKGSSSSLSPISYKVEGVAGSQIFKLEVSNATFSGDLTSTVSFQIWLYEADGNLELHMGPNTINSPSSAFVNGPFCAVHHVNNWAPTTYTYGYAVYDDLNNLQDSTFNGTGISTSPLTLDDCPNEGSVYIFSKNMPSSSVSKFSFNQQEIHVYPNPSTDFVFRKLHKPEEDRVQFRNQNGRLVLSSKIQDQYDIRSLSNGIYIMQFIDKNGNVISETRLVKN